MDARTQGFIDQQRQEARLAERRRLADIVQRWIADEVVANTEDIRLIRDRLLATDY
jgi:hypothetical protein